MKLSGHRICCISILVLFFCSAAVLADEIEPTISHVFFEKDGMPFNESVHFTVECYGYAWKMWDGSAPEDRIAKVNHSSELVYSYSASCPSYGCTIYEPYYHAGRLYVDHCDVKGQTAGFDFSIRNFSLSPIPNCTDLHQFMQGGGRKGGYYNGTPEFDDCVTETRSHRDRCDQYLVSCEPGNDNECEIWIVDGKNVKKTPAYSACTDTVDRERMDCDQFLKKIDPSTMLMWKDTDSGKEYPAQRACDLRFTIPSGTMTLVQVQQIPNITYGLPAITTAHDISPVESLYCSILNFFGVSCS
ncbi:MAG: hypothetical protein Q7J03_04015 [Methanoregula sp.]|nr:hypothetical protein [Methanoregula sp.]